jgi:hypothetical protein
MTRTAEHRIRDIVGFLAGADGGFESVRVAREALAGADDFDQEMIRLYREQKINLIPQSNQMALTEADWAAAVRVGGETKHLVCWESTGTQDGLRGNP